MESNKYILSRMNRIKIQGIVGEMIAIDYVLNNLNKELGDIVSISTNNRVQLLFEKEHEGISITHENALETIESLLSQLWIEIGHEGIDFSNLDIETRNIFEKYSTKTKSQMISELKQLYVCFEDEKKSLKQMTIERLRIREIENSLCDKNLIFLKNLNSLSKQNVAKILTLIELEKNSKYELDSSKKIDFLVTFSHLLFFPLFMEMEMLRTNLIFNKRDIFKTLSKFVNAKYAELNLLSILYRGLIQTKTRIDLMIIQYSNLKILKKIIIIESKTGDSKLTKNQIEFADYIDKMKSDKVEYRIINVHYQTPEEVNIVEITPNLKNYNRLTKRNWTRKT